jgi:hypothetical protein
LQDKKQLGSALNTIAYGQAMMAAVRDYAKVSAPIIASSAEAHPFLVHSSEEDLNLKYSTHGVVLWHCMAAGRLSCKQQHTGST